MKKTSWYLYAAWAMALIATVTSLYLSDVAKIPPCNLCWYQRIFMYPLVIILGVGIASRDALIHKYAMPFALLGGLVALYHNLLQWKLVPSVVECSIGVPCDQVQAVWFGLFTIPLLSLIAFILLLIFLIIDKKMYGARV